MPLDEGVTLAKPCHNDTEFLSKVSIRDQSSLRLLHGKN